MSALTREQCQQAAKACRQLATITVGRSHSDENIAREEALHDLARALEAAEPPSEQCRPFYDEAMTHMTGEQALTLLRKLYPGDRVPLLQWEPFDLPNGYVAVSYPWGHPGGAAIGIDAEGAVSS